MRAGPLSDDKVIERLNSDFVNSWIIIPQFEKPDQFFAKRKARELASVVEAEYTYPVDSIVISVGGKPLSQGEFNKFYSNDAADRYLEMLKVAAKQR